jgi:predicted helicase
VHDIVKHIRNISSSNHQRGTLFENLMVAYLGTNPTFTNRFDKVWRWADWPDAPARNDDGIDLVARTVEGGYCAIQCKFYEPHHTLR